MLRRSSADAAHDRLAMLEAAVANLGAQVAKLARAVAKITKKRKVKRG